MVDGAGHRSSGPKKNALIEGLADAGNGGGLGWLLTLIDAIASEYGWSEEAILNKPISRMLAYFAAICIRHGHELGEADYAEQELVDELSVATEGYGE